MAGKAYENSANSSKKAERPPLELTTSVQYLKGVGPKLGALLEKRGMRKVRDLLDYYPRAFEDRRAARNIMSLRPEEIVSLKARVHRVNQITLGRSTRKIYDVAIRDESGQIHCKFFRVPYRGYFERFPIGKEVRVIGKVTDYRGRLEFHHPELRDLAEEENEIQDDLSPIYVEIESLATSKIHRLIRSALEQLGRPALIEATEKLPLHVRQKYNLISHGEAIWSLHNPDADRAEEFHQLKSPAHRRIIFEEFFWLELYLAAKKTGLQRETGIKIENEDSWNAKLKSALPFELTGAQLKAFSEIRQDLQSGSPMSRLVQGDVGSGKTLVSFMAAVYAAQSGYQSALMAPTEILAEQHLKNATRFLQPLGIRTGLLTGKTKTSERKELLEKLANGEIDLLIGTHALIEDPVIFKNLALVVIDEQHRFGVEQRGKLKNKGLSPHFLIMTATPIPRTLAMTVYGDLEVSIINEMPKGRMPIQTRVIYENKRPQALDFMREQLQKGRQAYVVYPLVEESEKIDLKNAVEEFEKLKKEFPKSEIGLLHGRMKPQEKEQIMQQFREGKIHILVSTTVIEVGVDVPNANLMMIEHSERFGLSQLHQLRGRVGRGEFKSYCIMVMGRAVSMEARERTSFMEQTSDGFKIAEFDLELRGPGVFMGTRQSGLPGFKMANLVRDVAILQEAREAAFDILKTDPTLKKPEHKSLREELLKTHGPIALAHIA